MSLIHAVQAAAEAAPQAAARAAADVGLLDAIGRIDALGVLFIAGSLGLLWAFLAFIRDERDVRSEP